MICRSRVTDDRDLNRTLICVNEDVRAALVSLNKPNKRTVISKFPFHPCHYNGQELKMFKLALEVATSHDETAVEDMQTAVTKPCMLSFSLC